MFAFFNKNILSLVLLLVIIFGTYFLRKKDADMSQICVSLGGVWSGVENKCFLNNKASSGQNPQIQNPAAFAGLDCGEGYLAGVTEDGKARCRHFENKDKAVDFVGGYMTQGVCLLQEGKVAAGCKVQVDDYQECSRNVTPFLIRTPNLDYLVPSLCSQKSHACYTQNKMGTYLQKTFYRCEEFEVKGISRDIAKRLKLKEQNDQKTAQQ